MKFSVLVERDEDGYYIASVPELPGCHTQARTLDELTDRVQEAIGLYLESEGTKTEGKVELVGVQFVEVNPRVWLSAERSSVCSSPLRSHRLKLSSMFERLVC